MRSDFIFETFQLEYQARTAKKMTEMRSRKERFEIALRNEEVKADAMTDTLQEVNHELLYYRSST